MNKEHESAENPSFITLGAHRPIQFYTHDGDSWEPQYKNKILDVSGTT